MTTHPQPKPDRFEKPEHEIDYTVLAFAKHPPVPDPKFREWCRTRCELKQRIKGHRCAPMKDGTSYTPGKPVIDFAHIPAKKSMSQKGSDLGGGFGMCHAAHMQQEAIGWPAFAKKYGIDPKAIAEERAKEYRARHPQK